MSKVLKNKYGTRIGEIKGESYTDKQTIYDKNGNRRGAYDPVWDRTTDKNGNTVGYGNQLTSLISSGECSSGGGGDLGVVGNLVVFALCAVALLFIGIVWLIQTHPIISGLIAATILTPIVLYAVAGPEPQREEDTGEDDGH